MVQTQWVLEQGAGQPLSGSASPATRNRGGRFITEQFITDL